jgi:hypothetical protein
MTEYLVIALVVGIVLSSTLLLYCICANSSRISRERERHGLE